MKKYFAILILLSVAIFARSEGTPYALQTLSLGTNAFPASSTNSLPVLISSAVVTNSGSPIFYYATNSATNFVQFTVPVTNYLYFTNTFVESNSVAGVSTNTWTVNERVNATNNTPYYYTNGAYYTYSNGVIVLTNSAVIITNYQVFSFTTPVSYTIVGTNQIVSTNKFYGASFLDSRQSATIGILISYNLTGSGTSPVVLSIQPTVDGYTTNTAPPQTFSLAANGTTTVSTNISYSAGVFGSLVLESLANQNASAITNLVIKYVAKVQAP